FQRTKDGTVSTTDAQCRAVIVSPASSGLLHAAVTLPADAGDHAEAGLLWRASSKGTGVRFLVSARGCRVLVGSDGADDEEVARSGHAVAAGVAHAVQVLDHGETATCSVDGVDVFGGPVRIGTAHGGGTGVGL